MFKLNIELGIINMLIKLSSSLFLIVLSFVILTKFTCASSILFSDDFNDGNSFGWSETTGSMGSWSLLGGKYIGSAPIGSSNHSISLAGNTSWTNYVFEAEIVGISGVDRTILLRHDPSRGVPYGYAVKYIENNYEFPSHIELQKSGLTVLQSNANFISVNGQINRIRARLYMNNIKIYVNDILYLDYTDTNNPILNGQIGLFIEKPGFNYPGFNGITTTSYDNIIVHPINDIKDFNLPIQYTNRDNPTELDFKNAFWEKMTATFDHNRKHNNFVPFTTSEYPKRDCPKGKTGIGCYDQHNGVDFDDTPDNKDVLSVSNGEVVYTSPHDSESCTPNKGGYGCVVIAKYPDPTGTNSEIYTLYAHLSKIFVSKDETITSETKLGEIGNTGCHPKCGTHLHLGVMKNVSSVVVTSSNNGLKPNEWEELLYQIQPTASENISHFCTYKAPNGEKFSFQDPSGWSSESITDPWTTNDKQVGCGTASPYLWMHDIGTSQNLNAVPLLWLNDVI